METKINAKDLIGDLEGFPIEIVKKMLEYQFKQIGKIDISIFQDYNRSDKQRGGFHWEDTIEGHGFWYSVIREKKFDMFFKYYPKLSKNVYIRGDKNNGKNIIKELESRGGINKWNNKGDEDNVLYFIDPVTNFIEIVVASQHKNLLKTVYTEISPGEYTKVELTMQEIAEKFGIDVELLRIKK